MNVLISPPHQRFFFGFSWLFLFALLRLFAHSPTRSFFHYFNFFVFLFQHFFFDFLVFSSNAFGLIFLLVFFFFPFGNSMLKYVVRLLFGFYKVIYCQTTSLMGCPNHTFRNLIPYGTHNRGATIFGQNTIANQKLYLALWIITILLISVCKKWYKHLLKLPFLLLYLLLHSFSNSTNFLLTSLQK